MPTWSTQSFVLLSTQTHKFGVPKIFTVLPIWVKRGGFVQSNEGHVQTTSGFPQTYDYRDLTLFHADNRAGAYHLASHHLFDETSVETSPGDTFWPTAATKFILEAST